ncbi:MAG TPA: prolyl oligopeptidase family serine peptidase [Vicinamibacterales bacterium]|nr:prolyl oligopeptidase family serine peptidase [Vicinamibacterales bacterium]
MVRLSAACLFAALLLTAAPARAQSTCDPDALQTSGSIYRICMPPPDQYNGMLVVWAHGFQDAGTPVSIPEDQLCIGDFCIPEVINGLGFGFATNSYRKTGMAIAQGKEDIIDLVSVFAAQKGQPQKVFLVGASEGGVITALALEQRPDIFSAGLAACGPVGNFPAQINYFGDARATFEVFFPGVIPGDPFNPDPDLLAIWPDYYEFVVKPIVMAPANRSRLDQWVRVARLPYDADDYLFTVEQSVEDALRYSVVNLLDAVATIGGFPFDNSKRYYTGSSSDVLLNLLVPRRAASPAALAAMNSPAYSTSGVLQRPLITLHTLRDQQVPYWHEQIYALKTLASGSYLTRHLNIPIDRFEHCNFTTDEVLASFAIMLFYDGLIAEVSGTGSFLTPSQLAAFEARTRAVGLLTRRAGTSLQLKLK